MRDLNCCLHQIVLLKCNSIYNLYNANHLKQVLTTNYFSLYIDLKRNVASCLA